MKKNLKEYQIALQREHAELMVRIDKLQEYIANNKDDYEEAVLKRIQLDAMVRYQEILLQRMLLVNVRYDASEQCYYVKTGEIRTVEVKDDEQNPTDNN